LVKLLSNTTILKKCSSAKVVVFNFLPRQEKTIKSITVIIPTNMSKKHGLIVEPSWQNQKFANEPTRVIMKWIASLRLECH